MFNIRALPTLSQITEIWGPSRHIPKLHYIFVQYIKWLVVCEKTQSQCIIIFKKSLKIWRKLLGNEIYVCWHSGWTSSSVCHLWWCSLKPQKLRCHLEMRYPVLKGKLLDFYKRKLETFNQQKSAISEHSTMPANCFKASYAMSYHSAKLCKP